MSGRLMMRLILNLMESEMTQKNVRTTVLEEAIGLIDDNGPRQAHYGTPQENFGATSHMWSAYLGIKVSPGDVCRLMALLKLARLRNGPHHDSSCDGAAYLALGCELDEGMLDVPTEQP
jgi:hypothetical protein